MEDLLWQWGLRNQGIFRRCLQTCAAIFILGLQIIVAPFSWPVIIYLIGCTTWLKYPAAAYSLWIFIDRKTCARGSRRKEWFRDAKVWQHLRDYFPIELVKTAELPPDKNYLLAAHPHGVVSHSYCATFGTNALNFGEVFKGITASFCTVEIIHHLPFLREILSLSGTVSVSKTSLNWLLDDSRKGRAALVVVGGAEEARLSKPGKFILYLEKRKGFCKIALQKGCALVPVFSFGETDYFNLVVSWKGSWLEGFQSFVKKYIGIIPVIFYGSFGLIPRRTPITVVVGKPIDVQKAENPTQEQIDELHFKYKLNLVSLFEEQKYRYATNPQAELVIL